MIVIGHRGARGLAPENTLAAIQAGIAGGAAEIEIDIRLTKDDVPILSHDKILTASKGTYLIAENTYDDLVAAKPDLTTLEQALLVVTPVTALYIEVKHGEPTGPVITAVKKHLAGHPAAAISFGSKSQKTLKALHAALPKIPMIVIEPWSGVRAAYRARQLGTKRLSMRSWWLWRGFLKSMQLRGYKISPYTMNDPVKVAKWEPYIYGVVTDRPDLFKGQK